MCLKRLNYDRKELERRREESQHEIRGKRVTGLRCRCTLGCRGLTPKLRGKEERGLRMEEGDGVEPRAGKAGALVWGLPSSLETSGPRVCLLFSRL